MPILSGARRNVPEPDAAALAPRRTAADHAYEVLEGLVISGALPPGHRLTELSLAGRLGVSRTPLRQAVQRLVSNGWVQRSPNGAISVVNVSEREIEALYAVRAALEEMMLCQLSRQLDAGGLEALRGLLASQERAAKAGDAGLVSSLGEQFHRTLWTLSGNQVGMQFLDEVLQRTTRYRRLSFSEPYRFREGLKQHSRIVAALAKGDADMVRRLVRKHVDESRNYVLQAFRAWRKGGDAARAKDRAGK